MFGFRTPSFNKMLSARTTERLTRMAKRSVNPFYGKKGIGWINNPERAAYNMLYNKTTRGISSTNNGANAKSARYSGYKKGSIPKLVPNNNNDNSNNIQKHTRQFKNPVLDDYGEVRPLALIIGMIIFAGMIYGFWAYGGSLIKVIMFIVFLYFLISSLF